MSKILDTPSLGHYSIPNHNGFHKKCYALLMLFVSTYDGQLLLDYYNGKVSQEDLIFRWMRKKKFTAEKAEIDKLRDDIFLGILAMLRAYLRHYDPNVCKAALRLLQFLENYGDVIHQDYDAETTSIERIIAYLRSNDYTSDVSLLNLTGWIDRLEELNNNFKNLATETSNENIKKPNVSPKESRKQTDEALKKILEHIEALAVLNGSEKYLELATAFNELVQHYNTIVREHYGRIHAKIDISSAYILPIPNQIFTGIPVSVIPQVKLNTTKNDGSQKTLDLVFTKDFTVTYKNNEQKGMATIIVQGTGKYSGQVLTTFNID